MLILHDTFNNCHTDNARAEPSGLAPCRGPARVWGAWTLAALAAAWLCFLFCQSGQRPNFTDFRVYYDAGGKALAHASVYDVSGHYQYKYAPLVAAAFGAGLSRMPLDIAAWTFYVLCLASWGCLIGVLVREALCRTGGCGDAAGVIGLAAALTLCYGMGLRDEMKLGQINVIPLSLAFVAVARTRKHAWAEILAGMALCGAIGFKLNWAIFVPVLMARRRWIALAGAAAGCAVGLGATAALHGPDFAWSEHLAWIRSLSKSSSELLYCAHNVSIIGVTGKLTGAPVAAKAAWVIFTGAFLAAVIVFRDRDDYFWFVSGAAAVTLLSPLSWPYWMLFTMPAFLFCGASISRQGRARWWIAAAALVYLGLCNSQNGSIGRYGGTTLANMMILTAFAASYARRGTEAEPQSRTVHSPDDASRQSR